MSYMVCVQCGRSIVVRSASDVDCIMVQGVKWLCPCGHVDKWVPASAPCTPETLVTLRAYHEHHLRAAATAAAIPRVTEDCTASSAGLPQPSTAAE